MSLLIYDLLVIETWKSKVFPLLQADVATENSLKAYFLLYHEATVVNLLEIVLFNKSACLASGDALLDLTDYCARKFTLLNAWEHPAPAQSKSAKELMQDSDEEDLPPYSQLIQRLLRNNKDLVFTICMNAISIFRYLTDYIVDLPLSVMTRVLNFNDMVCSAVYLIESAPWLRRKGKHLFERFEDGVWKEISVDELPRLSKVEAQVWLALYNMLIEPECRNKYDYNTRNHAVILRLKAYLNETLVDQLPVLVDLQRHLEELTIMQPPDNPALVRKGLLVEQVPELLEEITRGADYKRLADIQKKTVFQESPQARREAAKTYDVKLAVLK
ncbi:Zinc finger MYND domain-containing protein 10 [Borealophlyctis nickersoniae]|nr:Zinc finger MYND domain-containing protein 10 [Borealophlyctis nickersoniae]